MKQGFFTQKETQSNSRPDGKIYSCASCGLPKYCENPKLKPYGNFKKEILIIGEFPGNTDDKRGRPWQGKTGRLLKQTLESFDIDLFEDCLSTYAVNCHPETPPTKYQLDCCRKNLFKLIDEQQPKLILLLGSKALYSFLAHRWKKDLGGIEKWRGFTIPDKDYKCWVAPVYSPVFVERSFGYSKISEVDTIWKNDLQKALSHLEESLPRYNSPKIEIIEDLSPLNDIQSDMVVFDYETTGKKPHAKGHRIVCVSVAITPNHAYVFMMPETKAARSPFTNLLTNERIGKIAQNMKFEDTWTAVKLRTVINNWEWDTMQASHVLDNRSGVTGLKFQTYVRFGIVDYDSEVSPYLHSIDQKNSNSINQIDELLKLPGGKEKLLNYCGLDSIYEYRLAMLQMSIMNYSHLPF